MKKTKKVHDSEHNIYLYTCRCGSLEHQLVLSYWEDVLKYQIENKEEPEFFLNWVVSPSRSWWWRLKTALAYLFKKREIYITEIQLDDSDLKEIKEGINKFLKLSDTYKKAINKK